MSNSHPSQTPKKLTRSTSNRLIGGVCGGVAEYLNMDATLVRILTVLISLFTGVPVILYVIALFVIPEEGAPTTPQYPGVTGAQDYAGGYPSAAAPSTPPEYAPYSPTKAAPAPRSGAEDAVWGSEGPPWEQRQPDAPATPPPPPAPAPEPVAPSEPEAPVVSPDQADDKSKGDAP